MPQFILALDQGTTSSRSILFDGSGMPVATAQREFTQHFPRSGWVEHDAEEIWATQAATIAEVLARARATPADVAAIGITNQRETTVLWDRRTGRPIAPAIVWQDRRTADLCQQLQGRRPRARGRPAHRTAARSLFLGHQAGLAARSRAGSTSARGKRRTRFRHDRQLAGVEAVERRAARDRRLQCQPHPAAQRHERPVGRLHARTAAHSARRAATGRAVVTRSGRAGRHARCALDTDCGDRRRPAGSAFRPGLLRTGHGQEHLRHGLLPADEHRHGAARLQQSAADDHCLADDGPALCARRRRVRRWRGRAVVAGRARHHRALSRHRSAGSERPRCRRRLSRARLHRTRQPALGRVRARNDGRAVARNDACPHRTRRARGDRFPERRGAHGHAARRAPSAGRTAGGRRRHGERPADAVPGRPARRAGRAAAGHGNDGARGRVPRRTRHGFLVVTGRGRRELAGRAAVRATDVARRGRPRGWLAGRRPSNDRAAGTSRARIAAWARPSHSRLRCSSC